jgi:hypothetical protein
MAFLIFSWLRTIYVDLKPASPVPNIFYFCTVGDISPASVKLISREIRVTSNQADQQNVTRVLSSMKRG